MPFTADKAFRYRSVGSSVTRRSVKLTRRIRPARKYPIIDLPRRRPPDCCVKYQPFVLHGFPPVRSSPHPRSDSGNGTSGTHWGIPHRKDRRLGPFLWLHPGICSLPGQACRAFAAARYRSHGPTIKRPVAWAVGNGFHRAGLHAGRSFADLADQRQRLSQTLPLVPHHSYGRPFRVAFAKMKQTNRPFHIPGTLYIGLDSPE